jgi:hypothetical protein
MGGRSAIPIIASAALLLGVYPHAARADGVPVTIAVAGIANPAARSRSRSTPAGLVPEAPWRSR